MASRTFFVANGTPLTGVNLGFSARSCQVNNRSSNYIFIPGSGRYCDPQGLLSTAITETDRGDLLWQPPPGKTEIFTRDTSQRAQVSFYSDPVPPGLPG